MPLFEAPNQEVERLERVRDIDGLIDLLQKGNVYTRREAAKSLGELHPIRATDALIRALKDQDLVVRYWAAEGLGKIGDERATAPLVEALEYGNRDLVEASKFALEEIGLKNGQRSRERSLNHYVTVHRMT